MSLDTNVIRSSLFAVAPKFNTSDVDELAIIDGIIEEYKIEVDEEQFGNKVNKACALLSAHHLELIGFSPATSTFTSASSNVEISKRKAKNLEIHYNTSSKRVNVDGNNPCNSTIYGQMYVQLRKGIRLGLPRLAI